MRIPIIWLLGAAAIAMIGVWILGQVILQPNLPLITQAAFSSDSISPNADGSNDIAQFNYSLSRDARVSLSFENASGDTYYFRQDEPRFANDYEVLFSGVVDGFVRPDENISGQVLRRLIPNGDYTWRLSAVDTNSSQEDVVTGQLRVEDGDSPLPEMSVFSVSPEVFTPNQDGISDHTAINVFLEKAADLQVYLLGPNGEKIYVAPLQEGRKPGEAGRHLFDYAGGIDLGADPPPDGVYQVVAQAQDDEGQVVQQTAQLTIEKGGYPLAEIVPQAIGVDVMFAVQPYDERYFTSADHQGDLLSVPDDVQDNTLTAITLPVGDMLVFKLTVENYSDVPLRTTGPAPGTVYQQDQRAATLKAFDESGAWRVGIDCTTAASDYPWRWAIGTSDDLYQEYDPDSGNTYSYLPPGKQVVVWGAIHMTEVEARNPQNCWAGLIHEDVEISVFNNNVGSREIELVDPLATSQN